MAKGDMSDRFAELRGYGCVITAAAEATARNVCAQVDARVGVFARSAWDEDPDDGCHLAMVTDDAYVMVCIGEDGESMLSRCSSDDAHYEGTLADAVAAVKFLRDHQVPNNHPELT